MRRALLLDDEGVVEVLSGRMSFLQLKIIRDCIFFDFSPSSFRRSIGWAGLMHDLNWFGAMSIQLRPISGMSCQWRVSTS